MIQGPVAGWVFASGFMGRFFEAGDAESVS